MFNRWLHDLTAFVSATGGIDVSQIPGYELLVATVNQHDIDIAALTSQVSTNTLAIADNTADITTNTTNIANNAAAIATHTSQIAAHTSQIATLNARSQAFNGTVAPAAGLGVNGDWYSDTTAKHIYVKTGGAWVLIV